MKLKTQAIVNGKYTFKLALDRAKKFKALPKYSLQTKNRRKILKIYIEAQILNLTSKKKYQVDHIIPLYSEYICGLHVHNNLQILLAETNAQKSNIFYPYREKNGRRFYYFKPNYKVKDKKLPKSYNRTKKNTLKLSKKRIKQKKSKLKTITKPLINKFKRKSK